MTTATEVGYVEMRIAKVVGLATEEQFQCVVLEEVAGDRQLPIEIGWAEAISWRRWSRHRSLPPPGCCRRRRPDAPVIPPRRRASGGRSPLAR